MTLHPRLTALTPADVDAIRAALRLAIRTERQTLHHERPHLPPGAVATVTARIAELERLADGLRPSAPPSLPMGAEPECIRCDPGALQPCGPDCPILPE